LRRSRSRSFRLNVRMPHNSGADQIVSEVEEAKVVERPSLNNKEPVWQAEIDIHQGGVNHAGNRRSFTVRGPPRRAQEQAEDDAKQLTAAAAEGARAVRALANQLHRG